MLTKANIFISISKAFHLRQLAELRSSQIPQQSSSESSIHTQNVAAENSFNDDHDVDEDDDDDYNDLRHEHGRNLNAGNQPIHESLPCTFDEAMIMLYTYGTRHSLNWCAITDLAVLVNSLLGRQSLPTTKYAFKKKFVNKTCTPKVHLQCSFCQNYLGEKDCFVDEKETRCINCGKLTSVETKYRKNHFVTLPVETQLMSIIERNIIEGNLIDTQENHSISDVHDASCYKELKTTVGNQKCITITGSVDGAVVFKSTKDKSLWPVQIFINEIKLEKRFRRENMLCVAFSFGETPDMNAILRPFIEELNAINEKGGIQIKIADGETLAVKVILTCMTMDTIAKSYVAKKTQFNSHYGCPYCKHYGTIIAGSTQIRYCMAENRPDRTHIEVANAMVHSAQNQRPFDGYKGVSPLMALDTPFDLVWQFAIDKMHSIDLGVIKRTFNLMLNSANRNEL